MDRNRLNQNWTSSLLLSATFALLASFQLGFNLVSFSLLKNLVRRYAKNEACSAYIKSSRHFQAIGLLDDVRLDADTIEMFGKRLNISVLCALKDNDVIRAKTDEHMQAFLEFMCRVHFGVDNLIAMAELLFLFGGLIGSGGCRKN